MSKTDIAKCNCEHIYQDNKYGNHNRVHTVKLNGNLVCTVCNKEKVSRNIIK